MNDGQTRILSWSFIFMFFILEQCFDFEWYMQPGIAQFRPLSSYMNTGSRPPFLPRQTSISKNGVDFLFLSFRLKGPPPKRNPLANQNYQINTRIYLLPEYHFFQRLLQLDKNGAADLTGQSVKKYYKFKLNGFKLKQCRFSIELVGQLCDSPVISTGLIR